MFQMEIPLPHFNKTTNRTGLCSIGTLKSKSIHCQASIRQLSLEMYTKAQHQPCILYILNVWNVVRATKNYLPRKAIYWLALLYFSSYAVRRRKREDRKKNTYDQIQRMKEKQRKSELRFRRRDYIRPLAVGLAILLGGYILYRYYWKYWEVKWYHIPLSVYNFTSGIFVL